MSTHKAPHPSLFAPRVARWREPTRRGPRRGGARRGARRARRGAGARRSGKLSSARMPTPGEQQAARTIRAAAEWRAAGDDADIRYELAEGIAKITINRPEVRNAFRPETLIEISDALERAREDAEVGVIVLTGEGPDAFCSGGDQRVRGDTGYVEGGASVGRFHVTDLHVQIRRLPKPVVAMVAGYAIGGGHVLHL